MNNQLIIGEQKINYCDEVGRALIAKMQVKFTQHFHHGECVTTARLNQALCPSLVHLENLATIPGLIVATSLHGATKQDVSIRVPNYTKNNICLEAGNAIATCSAVSAVNDSRDQEKSTKLFTAPGEMCEK